jgi:hypothetical protein
LEVSVYSADPTTWLDFITALSPILGALLAVGGVLLTLRSNNRRERDRQKHERLLKDAELEAQKESRLRDERIAAYRKLLAATTNAHIDREGVAALGTAYAEVSLLASTDEIDRAAAEVWVRYGETQRKSYRETQDTEAPSSDFVQPLRRAEAARDRFLALAQKELGIEGRTAGYRDLEGSSSADALPDPKTPTSEQQVPWWHRWFQSR